MDNKLQQDLLLSLSNDMAAMKVTTVEIKEDLKEHMRRSIANETMIQMERNARMKHEVKVEKHIQFVKGASWVICGLSALFISIYKLDIF